MARTFAEVHKDGPTSGDTHVETTTIAQGRRARNFSQVIADSTRGVDAGMNAFTPPRRDLSSSAYEPDYRGHILGEGEDVLATKASVFGIAHPHRGFSTGRIKRPPQKKPGITRPKTNPFHRTPHVAQPKRVKKFDEAIAERRAEKYSVDIDDFDTQGESEMDIVQAIESKARAIQVEKKVSIFKARDLARLANPQLAKEEAAERKAAGKVRLQKSEPAMTREAFTKSAPGGDIVRQIDAAAMELQKADPKLSIFKARDMAWQRNKDKKRLYDQATSRSRANFADDLGG